MNFLVKQCILGFFLITKILTGYAGSSEILVKDLVAAGFENVRAISLDNQYIITVENHIFTWKVKTIITALDIISANLDSTVYISLVLLENNTPKVVVSVGNSVWMKLMNREIEPDEAKSLIVVSEETTNQWQKVMKNEVYNRNRGKTDLVVHPQLYFENTLLKGIYEYQFNLAPAIRMSLWNGMEFTGQVIFPIHNDLGYEGEFFRPGHIILTQELKFERWNGNLAVGNFGSNRYGADLKVRYLLPNENWNLKINAGYTGSSYFLDYKWVHSPMESLTGALSVSWFFAHYNLEFEGGISRYIYGDAGIFGNCTRWFGNKAVGFYAQYGKENLNGGFFFTIPFPPGKRNRKHFFRIVPPEYIDFNYNAATEFFYGQTYRVDPAQNRVSKFYTAAYLKNQIINYKHDIKSK